MRNVGEASHSVDMTTHQTAGIDCVTHSLWSCLVDDQKTVTAQITNPIGMVAPRLWTFPGVYMNVKLSMFVSRAQRNTIGVSNTEKAVPKKRELRTCGGKYGLPVPNFR